MKTGIIVQKEAIEIYIGEDGKQHLRSRVRPCLLEIISRGDLLAADIYVDGDQFRYHPLETL